MRTIKMKRFAIAAAFIAMFATPAAAAGQWNADLVAPVQGPVRVDSVRLGDTLAANVHEIGQRDLDRLLAELRADVERHLADRGLLAAPDDAAAVGLDLVLEEATPNRPTFEQLAGRGNWHWDRPGAARPVSSQLSLASFGLGGALVTGAFAGADGAPLGEVSYRYRETDIRQAQFAATWTDAHRGIDMFASRLTGLLSE